MEETVKNIIGAFVTFVLLVWVSQASAGSAKSWAGTWQDENGGIISIREQDGF